MDEVVFTDQTGAPPGWELASEQQPDTKIDIQVGKNQTQINVSSEDRSKSKILAESRTLAQNNGPCENPSGF